MGTPKPLLQWRGEPLVRYIVGVLDQGGVDRVHVVVADPAVAASVGDRAIWNPLPERGMLSSVQEGYRRLAPESALLVCPCDLPQLNAALVRQVIAAWDGSADAIVVPTVGSQRGHPTLFGPKVAREILRMDPLVEGLNALVRRNEAGMVTVEVADPGPIRDADTPDEWAALAAEEEREHAVE